MSVKHVKKYYRDIEKMYLELVSELNEMKDDFIKGNCTEDELNNLLTPVKSIEENYKRLAYIMFLLYQPNRENKKGSYERQNKELTDYFKKSNLTAKEELEIERANLNKFKEQLKRWKDGRK